MNARPLIFAAASALLMSACTIPDNQFGKDGSWDPTKGGGKKIGEDQGYSLGSLFGWDDDNESSPETTATQRDAETDAASFAKNAKPGITEEEYLDYLDYLEFKRFKEAQAVRAAEDAAASE
ncbi:hypothetical protein OAS86_06310 [Gammaproteobacteria bacterium]|nr:hypothetical protein [Gammaproteobacteria bacterium]